MEEVAEGSPAARMMAPGAPRGWVSGRHAGGPEHMRAPGPCARRAASGGEWAARARTGTGAIPPVR